MSITIYRNNHSNEPPVIAFDLIYLDNISKNLDLLISSSHRPQPDHFNRKLTMYTAVTQRTAPNFVLFLGYSTSFFAAIVSCYRDNFEIGTDSTSAVSAAIYLKVYAFSGFFLISLFHVGNATDICRIK